jgi:glutathione synthase/RimK-type ligase-like ATP-grasp enzyme
LSTKKIVLVPNNMGSRAAKELAETMSAKLGYKVWRVSPERVRGRKAFQLFRGTDKLTQFRKFAVAGLPIPEWTDSRETALTWLGEEVQVVCRTLLRSSEGKGIVFAKTREELVNAPLYTKYTKKKFEYRVHILNGTVIDVQEKRKKRSFDDTRDTRIRNLANGYIFCRGDIQEPNGLRDLALKAVKALDYPLGAVDIIYNKQQDRLILLEVNANPGLMGETLDSYANAIIKGLV